MMKRTLAYEVENQDSRSDTLPLTKCVNLGMSLNLTEPQLLNLDRNRAMMSLFETLDLKIPKPDNLK